MKLPRNRVEFSLFVLIVSVLSVNIIAPLITCFETGFSFQTWRSTCKVMPWIWTVVVILVLLTNKPAEKLTSLLLSKDDSFRAYMIINCLINVVMMSLILTIVATWIGTRGISWEPIQHFFYKWPRNFTFSFLVEVIVAQPIARFVLLKKHLKQN